MEDRTPALRYMEFYDKSDPKVYFQIQDIFYDVFCIVICILMHMYVFNIWRLTEQPQWSSLVSKDEKQEWRWGEAFLANYRRFFYNQDVQTARRVI